MTDRVRSANGTDMGKAECPVVEGEPDYFDPAKGPLECPVCAAPRAGTVNGQPVFACGLAVPS